MNRVRAKLKLYSGVGKRKTAFCSGYRPLFDLKGVGLTSGMITLLDRDELFPGDESIVEILFLNVEIAEGAQLYFYECEEVLGECVVLQFLKA